MKGAKRCKLPVVRSISTGDVTYTYTVTIVNAALRYV